MATRYLASTHVYVKDSIYLFYQIMNTGKFVALYILNTRVTVYLVNSLFGFHRKPRAAISMTVSSLPPPIQIFISLSRPIVLLKCTMLIELYVILDEEYIHDNCFNLAILQNHTHARSADLRADPQRTSPEWTAPLYLSLLSYEETAYI